ncbi:putative metal-dependent hydrolase of the TIM-barrel fold protein (plasmid) [Variovorax sp. WDL1]|nr:hypothetical protein CHC06_07995 [Variovorax sp. B2]PNG46326.1 hypothetical protein CHC07_08074 [Variovorax sp. B4]VTV19117.1 putative metal-dependent hydrolase of the TIM-barrel fold protein [Variovorax sp. WDL1]
MSGTTRPGRLALRREEALEPGQPIVDAHHHLYDRPGHRYLLDEFLSDLRSGHDVRATVFVQARSMLRADGPEAMRPVGETEFASSVAAMCARRGGVQACAAVVGQADLCLGDEVRPVLEAHKATSSLTLPRTGAEVVIRLPCPRGDCHGGWLLDSPHDTRSTRGAGRLRRATGCSATLTQPERQFMSVPPCLPTRAVLPQTDGGCP